MRSSTPVPRRETPEPPKHALDEAIADRGVHPSLAVVLRRAHDITQAPFTLDAGGERSVLLTSDDYEAVDAAINAAAREIGVRVGPGSVVGEYVV